MYLCYNKDFEKQSQPYILLPTLTLHLKSVSNSNDIPGDKIKTAEDIIN